MTKLTQVGSPFGVLAPLVFWMFPWLSLCWFDFSQGHEHWDFIGAARTVGFSDVGLLCGSVIDNTESPFESILMGFPWYSLTLRLFKMPSNGPTAIDFGLEEPSKTTDRVRFIFYHFSRFHQSFIVCNLCLFLCQLATYSGSVSGSPERLTSTFSLFVAGKVCIFLPPACPFLIQFFTFSDVFSPLGWWKHCCLALAYSVALLL